MHDAKIQKEGIGLAIPFNQLIQKEAISGNVVNARYAYFPGSITVDRFGNSVEKKFILEPCATGTIWVNEKNNRNTVLNFPAKLRRYTGLQSGDFVSLVTSGSYVVTGDDVSAKALVVTTCFMLGSGFV